jgi:hypothetical protein
MSGTVSARWYFPDWQSDTGVHSSSLAARGLWKEMLCIAAANKGKDHGHVMVGGKKATDEQIAKLAACSVAEVVALVAELEGNGVFNRDRRGVIYCRRMVRAEISRGNGRQGGNPNFMKQKGKQNQVQPKPKPPIPEPVPEPVPEDKTPPPPGDGLFAEPKTAEPMPDWPKDYQDQFWRNYPRKTEKKAALAKLDAIRKSGTVRWAAVIGGLLRFVHHCKAQRTEERYMKHPTTWLNRGCWDDEYNATEGGGDGEHRSEGASGARPAGGHRSWASYAASRARAAGGEGP